MLQKRIYNIIVKLWRTCVNNWKHNILFKQKTQCFFYIKKRPNCQNVVNMLEIKQVKGNVWNNFV